MRYLVDKGRSDLDGYVVVSSLSEVVGGDSIEGVCYVNSDESDTDFSRSLATLNMRGGIKFVYYMKSGETNALRYLLFCGVDADIYDSKDLFDDKESIDLLFDEYKETGMTVSSASTALSVISNGVNALVGGTDSDVSGYLQNSAWVDSMNAALGELSGIVSTTLDVGIAVLGVFKELFELLDTLEKSNANTSAEIEKMRELIKELERNTTKQIGKEALLRSSSTSTASFGSFNVPIQVKSVVYVKVMGEAPFLLSFLWAFQQYILINSNGASRCATMIIEPRTSQSIDRYKNIPRVDSDSATFIARSEKDVYRTYEPVTSVWNKFFSFDNVSHYIVIDRTGSSGALLRGPNVKQFYASSSIHTLNSLGIPRERMISTIIGMRGTIFVDVIKKYPLFNTEVDRFKGYLANCKESFDLLYSEISKSGR